MADCPKLIPDDSGAITHTFIQLLTAENDINASNRAMLDSLKNHLPQAKQVVFIDVLVTTKRYADFRMKLLLADNTKGNNLIAAGKELATDYDATLSMILNGSADMTGKPFDQEIWEASRNSRWNQLSQSWRFSEKISTPSESEKLISKPLGNSLAKSNKSTDIATLTKRLNWIDDRLRVMYFKEVKKSNEKQIRTMDFIPGSVRLTFRDDNICVQKIPLDGKYGGYLQDELFILSDENSVRVEKRHIPLSILSEGQEESDMQLIANHINDESVGVPGVFDIAGGNMLVSKDFLLIGDNAFYLRYTCEWNPTSKDNYAKINYPTKSAGITPRDYLTKRLAERFLGSDDPKDVKWVGFNELKEVFSPSFSKIDTQIGNFQYQPVKHLDQFIALLGFDSERNEKGESVYRFAVAAPDDKWQNYDAMTATYNNIDCSDQFRKQSKEIVSILKEEIEMLTQNLKRQIKNSLTRTTKHPDHVIVEEIVVPLPLIFDYQYYGTEILWFISFLNGHLHQTGTDKVFLMPDYPQAPQKNETINYANAFKEARNQLSKVVKHVHPIPGPYTQDSALRCRVKVVR